MIREFWVLRERARQIEIPKISIEEWLVKSRFLVEDGRRLHPTTAAILFFHPDPSEILPMASVECARFQLADIQDFLDKQTLAGPIWKLPDQADSFLKKHLPIYAKRHGGIPLRHTNVKNGSRSLAKPSGSSS